MMFILQLQDVTEDMELQEFIRSVAEDGIEWAGIYGTKGFPTRLKTFGELVIIISYFIGTIFQQFSYTCTFFGPNCN